MTDLLSLLGQLRVLPVVSVAGVDATVRLAMALERGGLGAIEITLRSDAALDSIAAVKKAVPGLVVAAGTVVNAAQMEAVRRAGADFAVSPGSTPELLTAAKTMEVDFLPGVATASEVMLGLEHGYSVFKLFPAGAAGGLALLKSLAGPFPEVRFCPTGGLGPDNYRDYLALPNVICCGGSWMVSAELVENGRWDEIERLTAQVVAG